MTDSVLARFPSGLHIAAFGLTPLSFSKAMGEPSPGAVVPSLEELERLARYTRLAALMTAIAAPESSIAHAGLVIKDGEYARILSWMVPFADKYSKANTFGMIVGPPEKLSVPTFFPSRFFFARIPSVPAFAALRETSVFPHAVSKAVRHLCPGPIVTESCFAHVEAYAYSEPLFSHALPFLVAHSDPNVREMGRVICLERHAARLNAGGLP